MTDLPPDFSHEEAAFERGALWVVGIDEVGRGPLAGPVTAAAVRLDPDCIPMGLNDSKKLSVAHRVRLSAEIHACATVSIAHASVEEIDEINILRASHLAMRRALDGLHGADFALIDGKMLPDKLTVSANAIVRGDACCLSISAASIVAKTCRDALMVGLAQQHPGYSWETNAGYGTRAHLHALQHLGVTAHHRRSFAPVHNILYQENF